MRGGGRTPGGRVRVIGRPGDQLQPGTETARAQRVLAPEAGGKGDTPSAGRLPPIPAKAEISKWKPQAAASPLLPSARAAFWDGWVVRLVLE